MKLTAQSGDEHNGTFGNVTHQAGDGARVVMGSFDYVSVDETTDGDLDDFELSKLVFDLKGYGWGVRIQDGGNGGTVTINRCLYEGDADAYDGIKTQDGNNLITNNIVYGCSRSGFAGIRLNHNVSGRTVDCHNNTIIQCDNSFYQDVADLTEEQPDQNQYSGIYRPSSSTLLDLLSAVPVSTVYSMTTIYKLISKVLKPMTG